MDNQILGQQVPLAFVLVFVQNWLKGQAWFPWITQEKDKANHIFAIVVAGLTTVGIHVAVNMADHTVTIEWPTAAVFMLGLWHWLQQYILTKVSYKVLQPRLNGNGAPAPAVPAKSSGQARATVASVVALLCLLPLLTGCAAKRAGTGNTPPAPVSVWEQVNFDNLQIAVHNRAVAKALTAAQQAGFLEAEYYDIVSREGINITKLHQQLTPMLKDAQTIKSKSALVQDLLNKILSSADIMVAAAAIKDPETKAQITTEAQLVAALANTMLTLLHDAGMLSQNCRGPNGEVGVPIRMKDFDGCAIMVVARTRSVL